MNPGPDGEQGFDWSPYIDRYRRGEWRAPIFRDMIRADLQRLRPFRPPVLLDIGCGSGLDDDVRLQASLAAEAGRYVGVEPDAIIKTGAVFHAVHHCSFEAAPLEPASVDVAFAVMVLEHVNAPVAFWDKLHTVLRAGGVFWGFTMDARHYFAKASLLAKKFQIKEWYLDRLHGRKGKERYENYPVYYQCNTPERLERLARRFRSRIILNFHRVGQLDYFFPTRLRWLGRSIDRITARRGSPGSILAVRVVK
jgi:SAM-dependent methyltransferase